MKEYLATDTLYYIIGIIILAVAIVVVWRKTFKKELKSIKALESKDKWLGVTYKEDKEFVVENIKKLIEKGEYPNELWK